MTDYSGESGRKASAETIVDAIEDALRCQGMDGAVGDQRSLKWDDPDHRRAVREKFQQNGDVNEAILPNFGPEGFGENARDDCGEDHPFGCPSCGHVVPFGRTCGQSVCGRCGVAWVRDAAMKKAAKVRRVRKEKNQHTSDAEHQYLHHQIVSPPLSWYHDLAAADLTLEEAQALTKDVVKEILDEMRAPGLLVRHSYRGADDDGSIRSESDDRGLWKQRLNSDRDWFGGVRDALAWKPHYHSLVVSDFLKGGELVERVERETGWVIHRIADDDGVSLANDGAMARAGTYSLSHADIQVRDGHNRSAVWEVGSFQGDPIKSSSRFSARPSDLEWADGVVRRAAWKLLGLSSSSTECGAELPAVDDPDELARRIIDEIFPKHELPAHREPDVDTDTILYHVSEGHIDVDVETTAGGGGNVTVSSAFGVPVTGDGWNGSSIPDVPGSVTFDGADEPPTTLLEVDQDDDQCGCGDDHDRVGQDDGECDGTLVPLGELRQRGLLDDDEWLRTAPHADDLREADREWPDDLEPWRTSSPGSAIGVG